MNLRKPAIKRVLIAVSGGSLVVVGTAMLVLPGPGLLVIPAGLAVLGTEFPWARRLSNKLKARVRSLTGRNSTQ